MKERSNREKLVEKMEKQERFATAEMAHIEIYGRVGRVLAKMVNLSATGAFLELNNATYVPQKGDLIRATVHLRSIGKSRAIDAEIVWNNGVGVGVCFLKKNELLQKMFQRTEVVQVTGE